jgi:hypothetical protein
MYYFFPKLRILMEELIVLKTVVGIKGGIVG